MRRLVFLFFLFGLLCPVSIVKAQPSASTSHERYGISFYGIDLPPLAQIDAAVTQIAARALGFPEAGQIAEGKAADCLLIDLNAPAFAAGNDPDADFLYAGDTSCVDTVICAGRILMQGKIVPGEAAIVAAAREAARKLRGE